ncbi:hypothetical protein V1525DRAFT_412346 [Lipomyces kononenkoae]|uniref:Uncharacterized protein n=1 Tax=Lipomyces kononenkoae TaxID=34357 RepID=A0ACC3STQ0_LIPKO
MSLSLEPHCSACYKKENLLRCQACKVVFYCSRDHQVDDRPNHKSACNGIKKAQKILEGYEQELRAFPGDWMTAPNPFETGVGHFWGIHKTRPYMQSRYALVEALLKAKTRPAVQSALDHILDMLRLCRGDNLGVRDVAPALYLRLGKDQECYDFIKWWATTGKESKYDWGDMDLGYLDVKDANVFEDVDLYGRGHYSLSHAVSVTLIKIRILHDLRNLQGSTVVGETAPFPREILDNIRGKLVSTIVAGNKEIMDSNDQRLAIERLESQVAQWYNVVKESNRYFWPALIRPGNNLTARPQYYGHGTPEEMRLVLQYSYESWLETPGAIDLIREQMDLDT